jgi:hypothetical protein
MHDNSPLYQDLGGRGLWRQRGWRTLDVLSERDSSFVAFVLVVWPLLCALQTRDATARDSARLSEEPVVSK